MPPLAVLVGGPPASGKTALARALAAHLGATLLDLDVLTGALTAVVAELVGATDLDDPRLAGVSREARYATVFDAAADNLAIGNAVVLVAPFTRERRSPAAFAAAAERLTTAGGVAAAFGPDAASIAADRTADVGGVEAAGPVGAVVGRGRPVLVWLRASPELVRARIIARAADRDRDKIADVAAFLERVDFGPPQVDHVPVDAALPVAAQVELVVDALRRAP
ncbi:AAA family ATPase [Asanoa siamensis]|uniref:Shikimate kinase n=1 Tax=Asanoa siamensis TaxID=926357 RepID=A0ABQ4CZE7_9ACTN|nr:AAA family ATPase [Asanoa siamensis]GIF76664.1 hypothetical protein Asi02nite_61820 [Asanoa siamensis]